MVGVLEAIPIQTVININSIMLEKNNLQYHSLELVVSF